MRSFSRGPIHTIRLIPMVIRVLKEGQVGGAEMYIVNWSKPARCFTASATATSSALMVATCRSLWTSGL
jgi:hypothetical protein